jgi:hypothetical protein
MNTVLYIAWHADDANGGRWGPVGRLDHSAGVYRFVYTRGARMLEGFAPFTGMLDMEEVYESDELFPLFANRLLAKSRPEYESYLLWGGFDPHNPPDPLMIFGVTEGRRQTDSLELFLCPVPDENGNYVNKFFAHGVRWITPAAYERITQLHAGETLHLHPDDTNKYDSKAVALWTRDDCRVGYVPRYVAREVRELLTRCEGESITLAVQQVNVAAPLQQRLLCRVRSVWPRGFRPCSGEEFQPIASRSPMLVP